MKAILKFFPDAELGEVRDHGLDDYGLPPEEPVPELLFAPLDAEFLDDDERPMIRACLQTDSGEQVMHAPQAVWCDI